MKVEKYRPWVQHAVEDMELRKPLCFYHNGINHYVALLPKTAEVPYFDTQRFADINHLFPNAPDYEAPYIPVVQPVVMVID